MEKDKISEINKKPEVSRTNTARRGRGRTKRQRHSDSEGSETQHKRQEKEKSKSPSTKRKSTSPSPSTSSTTATVWSLEEKQRFVAGLSSGDPFRKTDGNINWNVLTKSIGTKSMREVKEFAKNFNALENGKTYEEFNSKAAVDVWRELASKLTMPGDDIDCVCIPQVLTVAALEPVKNNKTTYEPNYGNIYNYLSCVTRGTNAPDLPVDDAIVVLGLLEDLIKWLSKSQTLIQREFMHARYAELRKYLHPSGEENSERQYNTSTNPFAIPFDILEFKGEPFSSEPS